MRLYKATLLAAVATPALGWAGGAWAQAGQVRLDEIVVTAQRTSENLQRAAVAVTAVSGEQVTNRGVTEMTQLTQLAPAVQVVRSSGPYVTFNIRGVNSLALNQFGDPAIAVNVDQVFMARPYGAAGQFYDIERVEVVKGPQGILYGRNATGGAINIVTRSPVLDEFSGSIGVDVGNYDKIAVDGFVNIPLTETLAARLAFQQVRHDGYLSDGQSDQDTTGVRGSLRWEPNEDVSLVLRADWVKDGGRATGTTAYCAGPPASALPVYAGCPSTGRFFGDPWTSVVHQQPLINPNYPLAPGSMPGVVASFMDNEYYGASAELNWRVLGGTLTVIPAYRFDNPNYLTSQAWFAREHSEHDQWTFEARFASDQEKPLRYLVGAYYFKDKQVGSAAYERRALITPTVPIPFQNLVSVQNLENRDESWAAFGNLTWAVTDAVRLSAGIRYSWEEKKTDSTLAFIDAFGPLSPFTRTRWTWRDPVIDIRPFFNPLGLDIQTVDSAEWDDTSYRVGVEWDVTPSNFLYANVSTGFKSGGFFFNDVSDPLGTTYEPEKVTAYVAGSKNQFLDDRLRLNLEVFLLKYRDQQQGTLLINSSGKFIFPSVNVGRSEMKGAEVEAEFLAAENTLLTLDVQYLDATYDQFQLPAAFLSDSRCQAIARPPPASNVMDCSGLEMVGAPKWTVNAGVRQTFPLGNGASLVADLNTRWEDDREVSNNYYFFTRVDSYHRTNASLTYNAPDDRWSVTAYVDNIEDEAVVDNAATALNLSGIFTATLKPPRTYGLRMRANF